MDREDVAEAIWKECELLLEESKEKVKEATDINKMMIADKEYISKLIVKLQVKTAENYLLNKEISRKNDEINILKQEYKVLENKLREINNITSIVMKTDSVNKEKLESISTHILKSMLGGWA